MANHRMVSNRVVNSAKFLQMPTESQLLFFHMVLRADDDGIVESYPLMKLLGTPTDSLKVLIVRGFLEQINEDQVMLINNWREHNTVRSDRKVNSIYLPLLLETHPDFDFVIPKPRTDVENNSKRIGGPSMVGLSKGKLSQVNNIVAIATTYSFEDELIKLRDSKRKDFKIIALYWKKKGFSFENQDQFNSALTRELCAAKSLKGYTGEEIARSIKYCQDNYPEIYTLETVAKRIADLVNKK